MASNKGKAAAALIAAACAIAAPVVMRWEGRRNAAYLDPVKIPTICVGHTGPDVKLGQVKTDPECEAILQQDLDDHAMGVAACVPQIMENPHILAASSSLAFNIGVSKFCASTAARHFKAGNNRAGCEALGLFVYAGGKKLNGLVKRRKAEVELCLKGLE